MHVHVERDDKLTKFWLDPIRLQSSFGFSRVEIRSIERIVQERRKQLMEAWHAYFGGSITNPECGEPDCN